MDDWRSFRDLLDQQSWTEGERMEELGGYSGHMWGSIFYSSVFTYVYFLSFTLYHPKREQTKQQDRVGAIPDLYPASLKLDALVQALVSQ